MPFLQASLKAVAWKQETIRAAGRKYVICFQSQVWTTCREITNLYKDAGFQLSPTACSSRSFQEQYY